MRPPNFVKQCVKCGDLNRPEAKRCKKCGTALILAPIALPYRRQPTDKSTLYPVQRAEGKTPSPDTSPSESDATLQIAHRSFTELPLHAVVGKRYEVMQTLETSSDLNSYLVDGINTKPYVLYESANLDQFEREQRWIAARVQHRAVVSMEETMCASFGDHQRAYLAVEFPLAPAASLSNCSEIEILQYAAQLADALALAHEHGITVANIQPESIYFSGRQIKLWGSAGAAIANAELRAQDVFQLAGSIYQLAAPPDGKLPAFSKEGLNIFQRALAADPKLRYGDARAFYADVKKLLGIRRHQSVITTMVGRLSDIGEKREIDEDSLVTAEISEYSQSGSRVVGLYAVADGMGGEQAGEVASRLVTESILRHVTNSLITQPSAEDYAPDYENILKTAVERANDEVYKAREDAQIKMGSTVVAALLDGNRGYIANVGDSRAYVVSADNIEQITKDHSLVQALVDEKLLTADQMRSDPRRNLITRHVGDKPQVLVDMCRISVSPGQYLLLCCDGLWELVQDAEIQSIVLASSHPQEACRRLVRAANDHGGDDNITCVLVRIDHAHDSAT